VGRSVCGVLAEWIGCKEGVSLKTSTNLDLALNPAAIRRAPAHPQVDSLLACKVPPPTAAKVSIGVAIPIAAALIVYGAIRVQVTSILIGVFILWACWQLFDCLRKGQLDQHPLFAFTVNQQQQQAAAMVPAGGPGGYYQPYPVAQPAYPAAQPAYPPNPYAAPARPPAF